MPTPTPSWNTARVYGTWLNYDGSRKSGTWRVTFPVRVTNEVEDVIIPSGSYGPTALNTVPGSPSFDQQLPITDDPDNLPREWNVIIEISFTLGGKEVYEIPIRMSDIETGINLRSVVLPQLLGPTPPVLIRGVPGGIAELDRDGDVVDAEGNKVTGGGDGGSTTGYVDPENSTVYVIP